MSGPRGDEIEQRGDEVVSSALTGELDISVRRSPPAQRIADAVPSSARGVVVDMTALEFIDSSGVSMLFGLARQVGSHRQELRVVAPPGRPVARVLEIVEFERAAPFTRTWTRRWRGSLRRRRSGGLADEPEHGRVELLGPLEREPVRRLGSTVSFAPGISAAMLPRLPDRHEDVALAADHVRRHRERAEPVASVVAAARGELAAERLAAAAGSGCSGSPCG